LSDKDQTVATGIMYKKFYAVYTFFENASKQTDPHRLPNTLIAMVHTPSDGDITTV